MSTQKPPYPIDTDSWLALSVVSLTGMIISACILLHIANEYWTKRRTVNRDIKTPMLVTVIFGVIACFVSAFFRSSVFFSIPLSQDACGAGYRIAWTAWILCKISAEWLLLHRIFRAFEPSSRPVSRFFLRIVRLAFAFFGVLIVLVLFVAKVQAYQIYKPTSNNNSGSSNGASRRLMIVCIHYYPSESARHFATFMSVYGIVMSWALCLFSLSRLAIAVGYRAGDSSIDLTFNYSFRRSMRRYFILILMNSVFVASFLSGDMAGDNDLMQLTPAVCSIVCVIAVYLSSIHTDNFFNCCCYLCDKCVAGTCGCLEEPSLRIRALSSPDASRLSIAEFSDRVNESRQGSATSPRFSNGAQNVRDDSPA